MTHLDDGADLRAVMDRTMRDLDAPERCGPAALATGRRIRSRRRAAAALTGAATVAAVTAAFAIPALGGSGDATPSGPAASDAATPTPAPPTPTVSDRMTPSLGPNAMPSTGTESLGPNEVPSTGSESPAGWWDVPSTQMVDTLESLLPAGVTVTRADTTADGLDGPVPAIGGLSGTLTSGAGVGAFQVLLYPPDQTEVPDPVTTTDAEGKEHTTVMAQATALANRAKCRGYHDNCEPIRDASGEKIGRVSSTTERGTLLYEVFLLGPDGGGLNLTVMNSTGEKPGYEPPSAEVPPLTLAQLRTLAEDPAWTS
jgi:hypothetical protein